MTRRSLITVLLGLYASACDELRRYHSSVSFNVSPESPAAGQPVEVSFSYLDDAPTGSYEVVLVSSSNGEVVDRSPVEGASSRPTLTPPTSGAYGVEIRKEGRMIAHRSITARQVER